MKIRRTLAAVAVTVVAAGMSLVGVVSAGASPSHTAVVAATAPGPPSGYVKTYTRNFAHTVGLGDWKIQPGNGATVHDSTKPGAEFGAGVETTGVNQWAELISSNAIITPNTYVQALVYIPSAAGKDGMGRSYPAGSTANWPAFWTAGNPWPENGEIDALEGIRGQSQFHGFYGPSIAGKISSPNFNATPNSIGTGWFTITFLRQNGQVTAWYGSHKVGSFTFPTNNANEKLIFQNQSYSTSVCGNCFGPTLLGAKSTAWLSNVTVWSKPSSPTPTPTATTPTPTPTQTTPTPTPTPTTPTPTPTQTQTTPPPVTAAFSESCPAKSSTSAAGCGGMDEGPSSGQAPGFVAGQASRPNLIDVQPDGWSGSQGPATVSGNSYQDWTATETDTPPQANSAQILTYPSTTFNYYQLGTPVPAAYDLNNITSLTSDYDETMPPSADKYTAESAYDIWLNNWATEVMVWTDVHYQGVDCGGPAWTPECSGSKLLGTFTIGGEQWSLYDNGGGINGFYMWIPANSGALDAVHQPSGTVDLKAMLAQTAVSGGFTSAAPLTQIGFGWEVADTGGQPLPFKMNKIDVNIAG